MHQQGDYVLQPAQLSPFYFQFNTLQYTVDNLYQKLNRDILMDQRNPLPGRVTYRLTLDSSEEQRREQEERLQREQYEKEKQQKRKRKQEKRRVKQQEQRAVKQEAQRRAEEKKKQVEKYNDPAKLFQPDSDSGVSFSRIKRKIEEMYPRYSKKNQKNEDSEDDDQSDEEDEASEQQQLEEGDDGSQDDSEEQESPKKKSKPSKKAEKKKRNDSDSEEHANKKKIKSSVKIEPEMSLKDKLVNQIAVRWNYALPVWPPEDFDYEAELKIKGYRYVEQKKFKFADDVVDGLIKAYELDGYKGVYRSKNGLIDVRPKQSCPSLNFFYSKSDEELYVLLRKAYENQIKELQQLQFRQSMEQKLEEDLKRRLRQLVK